MSRKLQQLSLYIIQVIIWTATFSLGSLLIRFNLDYIEIAASLGAFAGATASALVFAYNSRVLAQSKDNLENIIFKGKLNKYIVKEGEQQQ